MYGVVEMFKIQWRSSLSVSFAGSPPGATMPPSEALCSVSPPP
jgi:hypothetical protein